MLFISRTTTRFISLRRSFSSEQIRVRFAPSPTGKLHIGGLRTALYNYLFARKHNGLFILRIEDTDQERLKPESLPNIYESLKWAGIEPDYGPHNQNDKKSDLGPLMQSQRLSLYQTHADQLLSNGKAYRCFCDPSRLELLRKNAAKRQEKIGYDGKCRHLSPSQIEKLLSEKRPFVIRFKFEQTNGVDREITFEDMAMGIHKSSPGKQEGDFIILKSDRFPTYHFANVVDDHLMKISHVLRGQEWLLSTAKHILIYEAFGWKHPIYAHLPLICNSDGSKISKRQNDIDVMSYQSRGYLPETLLSYLTTIGGGCKTQIAEDERFFADFTQVRENLVRNFDETKISNRPVKLNQELLDNMNRWFLKSILASQLNRLKLIDNLQSLLKEKYPNINEYYLNEKYLRTVLECSLDRIHRINELVDDPKFSYLWNDVLTSINCDAIKNSPQILLDVIERLKARLRDEEDFVESKLHANISEIFNEVKKRSKSKINFWKLTRLVLTGSENGPPLAEIFYILGKENSIYRLNLAIDIISKSHI